MDTVQLVASVLGALSVSYVLSVVMSKFPDDAHATSHNNAKEFWPYDILPVGSSLSLIIGSLAQRLTRKNFLATRTVGPSHMVRPRLSFAACMLNVALTPLAYFCVVPPFKPLSLRSLKSQASKAAKGLKNFGPGWYEKPYEQTMDMVNKANYSPIGRAAAHDFFLRRLVAKLRLEDEVREEERGLGSCQQTCMKQRKHGTMPMLTPGVRNSSPATPPYSSSRSASLSS